jgi:rhodanese-related sulfurtransferase
LPENGLTVFVCRGGRRSTRAAHLFCGKGYKNVAVLQGGMLAWEAGHLLEAVE